jgi:predicted ATP-dependent serine protease
LLDIKRYNTRQEHLAAVSGGDDARATETWERLASLNAASTLQTEREAFYDARNAFQFTRGDNLIRLTPEILNERLGGGLAPGDSVVVYARPEMGKTGFVVHLTATAASAGHGVLYLGNEEPIDRTVQRTIASLTGQPTSVCAAHPVEALAGAQRRGLGNITFRDLDPGTMAQIEGAIRQTRPRLVVLDQLRNILHKGDSATVRMEDVQKGFRALAKRYAFTAVSVTQAGDSADGKTFLTMGDVDNSNTGVPGACDVMIGIGATYAMLETPRRGLSFPKNKIGHNHEGVIVSFDKARSRVE